MKRISILLLAIISMTCSSIAYAQMMDVDDDRQDVVWRASVPISMTKDDIYEHILAYDSLDAVVSFRNMIAGESKGDYLSPELTGKRKADLPLFYLNGRFKCRIILRTKDDICDIEVCHMRFVDTSGPLGGVTYAYDMKDYKDFSYICMAIMKYLSLLIL